MPDDEQGHPIIPHEDVADVDCCGCLFVQVRGERAEITCNECGAVIRTVPAEEAAAVMAGLIVDMSTKAICSARCPHCGALNTFPGFSAIDAFVCSECGQGVVVEKPLQ
jgi:uncharacterized protein (DUF983 family)